MIEAVFFWIYKVFLGILPILATILLGRVAWTWWVHYIQEDFISGIDFVLLEIIPPRDVLRSPKAMELFISNSMFIHSWKGGLESYWQGAVWFWFSLEIVSIDGQVHFYIRTPTRLRGLIETQMYAQYPQAQVREAPDYTLAVDEVTPTSAWNAWGAELKLVKHEAFPIKTYVDFGLDKDPKEEFKVDPISPIIELFGSIKKGEQMWMQILITPMKKEYHTHGTWFDTHDWVKESELKMKEILLPYARQNQKREKGHEDEFTVEFRTPDFLANSVEAMSAKTGKLGFETAIRVMYVAKKEVFPIGKRTNASRDLRTVWRQYAKPDCNWFERINSTQADRYGGVFLISKKKVLMLANRMLHEYRERSFFHTTMRRHVLSTDNIPWPFTSMFIHADDPHSTYALNTEELATLWHFPGQILKVPTLERIESKEASPPSNLPI